MTNEEYLQWEPLVKKIAYKYRNNIYKIEIDDLIQIGAIGLIYAFEHYKEDRGASFQTYAYDCIERKIFREFQNMKRIKRQADYKSTSFDAPINVDGDLYLEEVISDDNVNVEATVINKLIIEKYKEEINLVLTGREKDIVYKTLFEDIKFIDLAKEHGIHHSRVHDIQRRGFRNLRNKSPMIRDRWLKMKEEELEHRLISAYQNTENVYFYFESNSILYKKYKNEIDILNFIQELFDSMPFDFKLEKYSSFILSLEIFNQRDIELFNKRKINKMTQDELLKQGYGFNEILDIERTIKKAILKNKKQVYEKWLEYIDKKSIAI
ncbi:sigma-70 family RNA polymerase sigma factor [Terrisporobacter petrolearius]|uniref:sigma-70 family RNA polymerase sigma factor n=1 Tax=Terrisporobacter petrolearius TaxID=1460447 RepID=UPI001D16764F|nr:sigma-70 family RNA polymerase sigma factor [Terrisporobacter petrolearius]MCC3866326.1 sigma-70 family RNA polymerase sigma factor [Terrisporobacter petrolearius]